MKRYSHLLISAILLTCATSALAGTDRTRQTAAPAVDTPAPSPTPAADAPATTPTPTTAKPVATNTPAAPDAPEPEKAQPAPVRLHVVRGSLFAAGEAPPRLPQPGEAAPAPAMSYTSVAPLEPKRYKKHDVITVIVREDSNSSTTAKGESKKQQDFDVALQQWVKASLSNQTITTSANPSTLPEVKFKYNNNRQNDATQERTDSASARIGATIVDVKPNGTLVIEATKHIVMDREIQDFKLSGTCRVEDVAADNSILSTQLAELTFTKNTTGEVRDGQKRGWLNSLIDKVNPF